MTFTTWMFVLGAHVVTRTDKETYEFPMSFRCNKIFLFGRSTKCITPSNSIVCLLIIVVESYHERIPVEKICVLVEPRRDNNGKEKRKQQLFLSNVVVK